MRRNWEKGLKRGLVFTCLLVVISLVASCNINTADTVAPKFDEVTNGELSPMTVNLKDSTIDFLKDVSATDNVDTKDSLKITVNMKDYNNKVVGTYVIEYTVADKAGNVATVSRKVSVVDSVAPLFTYATDGVLPADSHLQYDETYNLLTTNNKVLEVRDNYDTTGLEVVVKDNGGYNPLVAGVYTVTYSVKDSGGNETTATRAITVKAAIKYVTDIVKINEDSQPVKYNYEDAFILDSMQGATMRAQDELQLMTKEFFLTKTEEAKTIYTNNGGIVFLPYCALVVLDKDMNPVMVRNAAYAIEAIKQADGTWKLLKNGTITNGDGTTETIKTTFIDGSAPAATGVGIMGGNLESYIPDGGFVLIASASKGGTLDAGKIMVLSNLLDSDFGGGALGWAGVEANAQGLLAAAKISYVKDDTTLYEKPADMASPVLTMNKHVLSWEKVLGAKEYEIYIDGVLKTTITGTSIKMLDLGLEPSADGTAYKIQVKAISTDIRFYGDSQLSEELEYVMPNATQLAAPVVTLEGTIVSWPTLEGAVSYNVYAKQLGDALLLTNTTELSYDLSKNAELAKWIYNANIYVVAVGDGVEKLDSEASTSVVFFCGVEQVIKFGDGLKFPVIQTTAADYFARRNDTTAVGYASKNLLFAITDAVNITAENNEAYGFLVVIDGEGKVKHMINVLVTTKQYINYTWVNSDTCGYTANGKQIAPLVTAGLATGDQLLIGRSAGAFTIGDFTALQGRDVLANYYWDLATHNEKGQSWRNAPTITDYPTYVVAAANSNQLEAPVLSLKDTVVSWNAVENATGYQISIDGVVKETITGLGFDLLSYIGSIGKSGSAGLNNSDFAVKVEAVADGKFSGTSEATYNVASNLTDGTNEMGITYNLANSLWNGGIGINLRLNDKVSTVMTGACYKEALTTYTTSNSKNGGIPFMTNSLIVILDKDMKVKAIRFGHAVVIEISGEGVYTTTDLKWNNGGQSETTPGGNFLGLDTALLDTDYVLIGANSGSKTQLVSICTMFVNTNAKTISDKVTPTADSATKVVTADKTYSLKYTVTAK